MPKKNVGNPLNYLEEEVTDFQYWYENFYPASLITARVHKSVCAGVVHDKVSTKKTTQSAS